MRGGWVISKQKIFQTDLYWKNCYCVKTLVRYSSLKKQKKNPMLWLVPFFLQVNVKSSVFFFKTWLQIFLHVCVCIDWMWMSMKLSYGAFFNAFFKMTRLISAFSQKVTPYKKGLVLCRSPCQIETYLPGLSEWLLVQYQTKTKISFATPKADPVMFYNRKTTIIF